MTHESAVKVVKAVIMDMVEVNQNVMQKYVDHNLDYLEGQNDAYLHVLNFIKSLEDKIED